VKFSRRPSTIFLKEFKATFSIVVCELEFKYGANYTEAGFCKIWRFIHFIGCVQHFRKVGTSSCTLWGQYYGASIMLKALAYANCAN
jgi:hypothetical protein